MMRDLILNSIEVINSELENIEKMYAEATEKQSILDNLRNDIEHEIELNKLSGSEMMIKYKELQACLRLRRKYKDGLEYLLSIRIGLNLTQVKNAKENISKVDNKLINRDYSNRVKQEVREELLKEMEG